MFPYIGGVYIGDGNINREELFRLRVVDKRFADSVYSSLENLGYEVNRSTRDIDSGTKIQHCLRVYSPSLCTKLSDLFNHPDEQSILDYLGSVKRKKEFIRGFYESDGSWSEGEVSMWQKNRWILDIIKILLSDIGIESKVYFHNKRTRSTEYSLRIMGSKTDRIKFFREIKPVIKTPENNGVNIGGVYNLFS